MALAMTMLNSVFRGCSKYSIARAGALSTRLSSPLQVRKNYIGTGRACLSSGSNMTGWVKTAENTSLVYIQHGHDNFAWSCPNWRRMVLNAIKWTASPAGKAWAKANPKRIFV
jgi:hypothetical protein